VAVATVAVRQLKACTHTEDSQGRPYSMTTGSVSDVSGDFSRGVTINCTRPKT